MPTVRPLPAHALPLLPAATPSHSSQLDRVGTVEAVGDVWGVHDDGGLVVCVHLTGEMVGRVERLEAADGPDMATLHRALGALAPNAGQL